MAQIQWNDDLFCEYIRSVRDAKTLEQAEVNFCANTGIDPQTLRNSLRPANGVIRTVAYV
jgi:hypothetical protein